MKNLLVLGAGKSATQLIDYLLEKSTQFGWQVTVGDLDVQLAKKKVNNHPNGRVVHFDVNNAHSRNKHIGDADVVASLLPAKFHDIVTEDCLRLKKHLVTASYLSPKAKSMHQAFQQAGLLFMAEIGLDPGIDHLATMEKLHQVKNDGGEVMAVKSYTGALIAPESDTNPWHYKFTWAPMNVVTAGQGVTQYLNDGEIKYVPYNRVFSHYMTREIPGYGTFEIYPNRNSNDYSAKYNLKDIKTFLRGTLRKQGYCDAWNALIKLGWTDNTYTIKSEGRTYTDLMRAFFPVKIAEKTDLKEALSELLAIPVDGAVMQQLEWLGLMDNIPIPIEQGTPAQLLCKLLESKWELLPDDKDMIVMVHEIDYRKDGKKRRLTSQMISKGKDAEETAIARLVGLPAGIMVKMIANNEVNLQGVYIPIMPEVYTPLLKELEEYGVKFEDRDEPIDE